MSQSQQHMTRADWLLLVLLGGLWGASFLFMKIASPQFGPIALIEVRVIVAAIFLSMFVSWDKGISLVRRKPLVIAVVGCINSAIPFSLFAFAALSLPAGMSAVLNATAPFFGAMVAFVWLKESMAKKRVLGLLIGFAGVVILVSNKLSIPGSQWGIGAGLLAALLYGIAAHFTKRHLGGGFVIDCNREPNQR
jgi:drug/metabolite transporter (DMT)-like permease